MNKLKVISIITLLCQAGCSTWQRQPLDDASVQQILASQGIGSVWVVKKYPFRGVGKEFDWGIDVSETPSQLGGRACISRGYSIEVLTRSSKPEIYHQSKYTALALRSCDGIKPESFKASIQTKKSFEQFPSYEELQNIIDLLYSALSMKIGTKADVTFDTRGVKGELINEAFRRLRADDLESVYDYKADEIRAAFDVHSFPYLLTTQIKRADQGYVHVFVSFESKGE